MTEPRVLVLLDCLGQGGTEASTAALLPLVRDSGIDVRVVLLRSVEPDHGESTLRAAGVPVEVLGVGHRVRSAVRPIRGALRRIRPDLLHVALFTPVVAGGLAAVGSGVPVLASQVNTPPEAARGGAADAGGTRSKLRAAVAVEAFACRHLTTHVHAVTPGVRDAVRERFRVPPERITVAERGRDPRRFSPADDAVRLDVRAELGIAPDDEVVLVLARHEPQKGLVDLVRAVEVAARDRTRLVALVAGREGTATPAVLAALAASPAGRRVRLLGDRPDPERLLAAADVLACASLREGAAGATVEAMAMGVPVVTTDVRGLRGVVEDGVNARVVPVGDADALGRALAAVLADPPGAAARAAEARRTFTSRFTTDAAAAALADLYRSVAAGAHAPRGRRVP